MAETTATGGVLVISAGPGERPCAMFGSDGKLVTRILDAPGVGVVDLGASPLLHYALELADVEIRHVDGRALSRYDRDGDRLRCMTLAEVQKRVEDLQRAAELREQAEAAAREASRLEGR